MEIRDVILYFSLKHQGNWEKIYQSIANKDVMDMEEFTLLKKKQKNKYVTILDEDYPDCLKCSPVPPYVLYYVGDFSLLKSEKSISVVGSRAMSKYGEDMCRKLVTGLVYNDYVIVSGLAKGIDAVAHDTCLKEGGKTIAVLGNGVDIVYPSINTPIYHNIVKDGGLIISEYPDGVNPSKENFPKRNRIVAYFGDSLLVCEAKERSGALISVRCALNVGKDIYCVPYPATAHSSCNRLIKEGANLVENIYDII